MYGKNLVALVLVITLIGLFAAPPPASASLVGITVALVIAFAGTVAVTETVRHQKLKDTVEEAKQQPADQDQASIDTSQSAPITP